MATFAASSASSHQEIDARPVRPVSDATLWDVAVRRRDEIEHIIRSTLDGEGISALVISSSRGNYPPWVRLEAWLPVEHAAPKRDFSESERVLLEFVVGLKPYRQKEIVTTVSAWRGNKKIGIVERANFSVKDCGDWVRYVLRLGGKPKSYRPIREGLWRLAQLIPFMPSPFKNKVKRDFRTGGLTGSSWLLLIGSGLLFFGSAFAGASPMWTVLFFVAGLSAIVASIVTAWRRKEFVALASQSTNVPRNLALIDSWHAVVAGIGHDFTSIQQRLIRAVVENHAPEVQTSVEVYGYRTPNGYEERERLIVSKGQSMVLLNLARFGEDVYVGWQASLNCSKWDEGNTVSSRVDGNSVTRFVEIKPGDYQPSQFDLIDLNSLSELVHRRLEREIKAILKERAIDQEIDFQIIRGSRSIADGGKPDKSNKKKSRWGYG